MWYNRHILTKNLTKEVSFGAKNESFFDPFDLTSMMLLFIIIHTNQKNFTVIIMQAV